MAETQNCGYWWYSGSDDVPKESGSIKPIDPSQLWPGVEPVDTEASESHSVPRVFTRAEKGQALTHLEMDFNLASLLHKLNTSSLGSEFASDEESEEGDEQYGTDIYFERHKPTREEEMAGMFATFSYAPVVCKGQSIIQNAFQTIKIQHTTDEIRYKLSNETIPGTLDIAENFHVSGSSYIDGDQYVSGSLYLNGIRTSGDTYTRNISCSTLNVQSSSSFASNTVQISNGIVNIKGRVDIDGDLYVNGKIVGNLSDEAYNSPNYATPVQQPLESFGTLDNQSDIRLKENLTEIKHSLAKLSNINGYQFDWKPEAEKQGHDVGLVAQELQVILPEAVSEGQDGYLRVDYTKVIPLLVAAIKELSWQVEELKSRR